MRFETEADFEKYFSRMKAVETMIEQGIYLMEKAIELNRTNHEVSMVTMCYLVKLVTFSASIIDKFISYDDYNHNFQLCKRELTKP